MQTQQDLINFASAFIKFCSVSLSEETFAELVGAVCSVYWAGGSAAGIASVAQAAEAGAACEGAGGGAGGGGGREGGDAADWNMRIGCLAFFDVVARYTLPPVKCLEMQTDVLCMAVNETRLSREAWAVMRNMLVGSTPSCLQALQQRQRMRWH